ncbi:protein of unknown function [Allopseudospirillum japonicum]|uniref:DUF4381 domain-containing protein n=1 Tax=Allopseudospirillum japonicum TaxID=64971 RepID=A0A1H6T6L7_9GAMM|nr:DUF4381 domain-containing protein [Allopseudospirillum japonicum]SEI72767.1 protein of unknown function [Allopseudospirillum japonicum]
MDQQALQAALYDIEWYANWWPPIGACVLALTLLLFTWGLLYWRAKRWRRLALAQWRHLASGDLRHPNADTVAQLNALLKQVACTCYPQELQVRALSGDAWIAWLDAHVKIPLFADTLAGRLLRNQYHAQANVEPQELKALLRATRLWIKQQT